MPKPCRDSEDEGGAQVRRVVEAKLNDQACLSQAFTLAGRGVDTSAPAAALERIERKLEAVADLPSQLAGISGRLAELQRGLHMLTQPKPASVPLLSRSCTRNSEVGSGWNDHDMAGSPSGWRRQVSTEVAGRLDRSFPPQHAPEQRPSQEHVMRPSQEQRPSQEKQESAETPMGGMDMTRFESNASRLEDCGSITGRESATDSWLPAPRMSSTSQGLSRPRATMQQVVSTLLAARAGPAEEATVSLTRRGSAAAQEGVMAARTAAVLHDIMGETSSTNVWIMRPDWKPRLIWDVLLIVSVALNAVLVSYGLVYNSDGGCLCGSWAMSSIMHTADGVWLANIFVAACTGYTGPTGQLVLRWRLVFFRYFQRWLAFDVLMLWPLVLLSPAGAGRWLFGLVKYIRLVRLLSLFNRLLRSEFQVPARALKWFLAVVLPAHTMACLWQLAYWADDKTTPHSDTEPISWLQIYVKDAYWVFMTMTTVGYGDISPIGTISRLFSIFAMLMSSVFFGAVVSVTSQAIGAIFDDPDERRLARALYFMRRRGVDPELMTRVENSLRRRLQQGHQKNLDPDLFRLLMPTVQRELALALLQGVVLQFPLFKGVNRSFVGELAQAQNWLQCSPGDVVAEDGQLTREVVFVVQGRLAAFFGPRSKGVHLDMHMDVAEGERATVVAMDASNSCVDMEGRIAECTRIIETGAWFGEACLFDDNRIRTATIVAREDSDLAVLQREDFFAIIQRYPRLMERHSKLQRAILKGRVSIEALAYGG